MKNLLVLAFAFFCVSTFAATVENTVKAIEVERNAQCTFESKSTFKKCFGATSTQTCFYAISYKCESNEGSFGLKVKVKDFYNLQTNAYETKVRGTTITK